MNKNEFLAKIAEKTQVSTREIDTCLNAIIEELTNLLAENDSLRFSGLGTFSVKTRAARTGRNPKTGEPLSIAESKVINFSAAKEIKERLNKK